MRILFIGDIVARPGRNTVREVLPQIRQNENIDFVIANAENLAHGRGATLETIREMQEAGVDFFTGGDHLFWHKGFDKQVDDLPIIRPVNYSPLMPGKGYEIADAGGEKLLIINIMGQTFINETLDNPFTRMNEVLDNVGGGADVKLVDVHAEATSEKLALGYYLDGRVDAVVGTHTHVPTCDGRILPNGTMFISDVGMTGNVDTVLGVKKEIIIDRMAFAKKARFEWEYEGRTEFRSVLLDTSTKEIRRVDEKMY